MSDQDQASGTRSADKNNAAMEAIQKYASAMDLEVPNMATSDQLNQNKELVRPNGVIWLRIDKEESKKLNIEEYRDLGWYLFNISGIVADQSTPTVNLQFYRKSISDKEIGAMLDKNHAWEVYSSVQDK